MELKKNLVKMYSNPTGNPENISAKAYIVVKHFSNKTIVNQSKILHTASNSKINAEIASLTKIMTCILIIELCEKYGISIETQNITIGSF